MTTRRYYDGTDDNFMYNCDEVPFDEIPPEPGREIQDSGYGDIVIRVQKDSADDYVDDRTVDELSRSPAKFKIGPLQRTIHQSSERVVQGPDSYEDDGYCRHYSDEYDSPRKRKHHVSSDYKRGHYGREVQKPRTSNHDDAHYDREPRGYHEDYQDRHHTRHHEEGRKAVSPRPVPQYDMNGRRIHTDTHTHKDTRHHYRDLPRDYYESRPDNYYSDRNNTEHVLSYRENGQERAYYQPSNRVTRQQLNTDSAQRNLCNSNKSPLSSHAPPKPNQTVSKPNTRPLSERLGPPLKRPVPPHNPLPSLSRPYNFTNKKPSSIIKHNIAASAPKNKHLASRPIGTKTGAGSLGSTVKQGPQIKKVNTHNPISKAKQKTAPKKTNLSKNIALSNKKNSTRATSTNQNTSCSTTKSSNNVIADLIQGILAEPDVKEMITTIAQQSVSETKDDLPVSSSNSQKKLEADTSRILDQANRLLNNNFQGIDANEFQTNRKIPSVKKKQVKPSLYCKECKLEFPTTMLRDLHYKTEMHCFVNGDWWKFNPKPPARMAKNRYPISIFCILCWDIVRLQSDDAFQTHMNGKRHKTNKQKFQEIFGRLPQYDWCMWEELSLNFRNNFVPVPSQLRNVMHPEYFYDQRVIRK